MEMHGQTYQARKRLNNLNSQEKGRTGGCYPPARLFVSRCLGKHRAGASPLRATAARVFCDGAWVKSQKGLVPHGWPYWPIVSAVRPLEGWLLRLPHCLVQGRAVSAMQRSPRGGHLALGAIHLAHRASDVQGRQGDLAAPLRSLGSARRDLCWRLSLMRAKSIDVL